MLTQQPFISASPGITARIGCTLSADLTVGRKNIYWYQQKPGSQPRFFLYYYSDTDKQLGPRVPNRVSGSKDASTKAAYLLISGLQPEDEADYYCQVNKDSAYTVTETYEEVGPNPSGAWEQWVRCLPCTWPAWFNHWHPICSTKHCQKWFLSAEAGGASEHCLALPSNKQKKGKENSQLLRFPNSLMHLLIMNEWKNMVKD